jgi:hypothetical protein
MKQLGFLIIGAAIAPSLSSAIALADLCSCNVSASKDRLARLHRRDMRSLTLRERTPGAAGLRPTRKSVVRFTTKARARTWAKAQPAKK